jgi:hypothetical protein
VKILLSTAHTPFPYFRQTPNGDGRWGSLEFTSDACAEDVDWFVVLDEPPGAMVSHLPKDRRILFVTEPPGMKAYPVGYLNQFGTVISPIPLPGYRGNLIQRQSALPWHYGIDMSVGLRTVDIAQNWDALAADKPKSRQLSVICSNKVIIPHHQLRLDFVKLLKQRLGNGVDVFGRGFREVNDRPRQ